MTPAGSQAGNINPFKKTFVRQKDCNYILIIRMHLSPIEEVRLQIVDKRQRRNSCIKLTYSTVKGSVLLWQRGGDFLQLGFYWTCIFNRRRVVLFAVELQTCCTLYRWGGVNSVYGAEWHCQANGLSDFRMEMSASWQPFPFMCSVWLSML